MLRNIVLVAGGALFVTGVMGLFAGAWGPASFCIVWGAIFVFAIVYERYAYKNIVDVPPTGKGWTRTLERFVDEKSGRTVTVYVKPITGERAYVAEQIGTPAAPPPVVEG
jgi:hypothetical protein